MKRRLVDSLGSRSHESFSAEKSPVQFDVINRIKVSYKKGLIDEQASSSSKRQKKNHVDVDTQAVMSILDQLQTLEPSAISTELWEAIKILMKSGYVSLQSCPNLIEKAKLSSRYDILLDLVRVVSDVTVADIVNIWVYCLKSTPDKLDLVEQVGAISSGLQLSNDKLLNLLILVVESILLRSSAFTLEEISEDSKALSSDDCFPMLRLFAVFIRASLGKSSSNNFDESQMERAVVWLAGIIDGHFANLLLEVRRSASYRMMFQHIFHSIELGNNHILSTELALKFSSQIKRMCTVQNNALEHKVQRGLYETEVLNL